MEYALFFILLCMSSFFSGSETALFSIGKVALTRLQQSPTAKDRLIARLLASPRDLLVTVLLGNELTNIALSIVSAGITRGWLEDRTLIEQALLSAAMVVPLLLVVGEITPKTLAAQRAEGTARIIARPLSLFAFVTTPIRYGLRRLTDATLRRFAGKQGEAAADNTIDEREFRTLVDVGAQEGVVEEGERALIHNVLDFGDLRVRDVMMPWDQVYTLSEELSVSDVLAEITDRTHSRIPVWSGDPRNVVGVLFVKDLLAIRWGVRPPPPRLRRLVRRPLFTLGGRSAADLLEEFRTRRTHLAVVVDEFGRARGLVTMEDLLEELFGPIHDDEAEATAEATRG
ncbi:MAG: HlyC/CorC family transporter [Myxococcales bacterium]|nr:HlyC/CorC family transporter [Myxococcales bacterium]